MNIFVLDENPRKAARMMCDKHIPKMIVESYQMLGSALLRHGADPESMPLTKKGTPLKGGYPNHPCTIWSGDSSSNWWWLHKHAEALCCEYTLRFGKTHFCEQGIYDLAQLLIDDGDTSDYAWAEIPNIGFTPYAQAMPDEYRDDDAVTAYRRYYHSKSFAKWERGRPEPRWWQTWKYFPNDGIKEVKQ